jgi:DNA polymerase III gamma/tau subunit
MQFSFKQVVPDLITARLQQITIAEGIEVADARVLPAIAFKAGGAMRDAIMTLEQLSNYKSPLVLQDFLEYYGLVGPEVSMRLLEMARNADIVGAKALIAQHFTRSVDVGYFLDNFMVSITDALHSRLLTSQQVVESYKVAVEVRSKLKFMSAFVAANYLFASLLRVFSYEGEMTSQTASKERLTELFQ